MLEASESLASVFFPDYVGSFELSYSSLLMTEVCLWLDLTSDPATFVHLYSTSLPYLMELVACSFSSSPRAACVMSSLCLLISSMWPRHRISTKHSLGLSLFLHCLVH